MPNIKFTLGVCSVSGHNYRFDFENGGYTIYEEKEESETVLQTIANSREAYAKWNELKRPEKRAKKQA